MARATTRKAAARPDTGVVSLKITLRGGKPPIWRRVLVPASLTLADLHAVIQCVMPWEEAHLHAFDVQGRQFGDRSMLDDAEDERRMTLKKLIDSQVGAFTYTYDFGDDWEHQIVIEKPPAKVEPGPLPRCVTGKRAGPPEDCGGVWGYMELLEILADPSHPEHAERKDWLGDGIDAELFDLDEANERLAGVFGPR